MRPGYLLIPFRVYLVQVVEMSSALSYHLDQPPAGVLIAFMLLEMLHQSVDLGGEEGHLDLRRAGIGQMEVIFLNYGILLALS
jgi:hypothetical protein